MSKYFLGVDGGQSSTVALIGDEIGRALGAGRAGPCNHVRAAQGRAKFLSAITGCLEKACEQAGLDAGSVSFEAACLGFSGGPADKEAILGEVLRARRLVVTHDALIALVGATAGQPGLITIAGTGSIAFGRNAGGRTARAGGWGYVFGDEGGAFDLARQALRAALRFEEGWGPSTSLHSLLLEATGATDANDLLHRCYTTEFPRPRIAKLAKLVDAAARADDEVALGILENAGEQLAALAGAVRGQLFHPGESARVSFVGGVFASPVIRERYRMLVEHEPGNLFGDRVYGPAAGALLEAYRIAGLTVELNAPGDL